MERAHPQLRGVLFADLLGDTLLHLVGHGDFIGPLARVPLRGPSFRSVNPQLRTPFCHRRSMIKHVKRAVCEHKIASCVYVIEYTPPDFLLVLHVYVGVYHDDHFREHHLPHAPDCLHDLLRLLRITLLYRHHRAVMEHSCEREIYIDDFRNHLLKDRQKYPLGCLCNVAVLHRGFSDYGCRVNRIFSMSDARDMKYRIIIRERIVTRMIAKRAFPSRFIGVHISFKHNLKTKILF